jgi:hypothetical protein
MAPILHHYFEYKRLNQPNDPSMAILSAQPPHQMVIEGMVIEDSESSEEWGFDEETAGAPLDTDMTSIDQPSLPPPAVSAHPQPTTQLPIDIVCPPRTSAIRVRKFRFEPIGVVPWPSSMLNCRGH